jgi:hypothetical protein
LRVASRHVERFHGVGPIAVIGIVRANGQVSLPLIGGEGIFQDAQDT